MRRRIVVGIWCSPRPRSELRIEGCESGGIYCAAVGVKEGEIVTNVLEGRIGIDKPMFVEGQEVLQKDKVELDLLPGLCEIALATCRNGQSGSAGARGGSGAH